MRPLPPRPRWGGRSIAGPEGIGCLAPTPAPAVAAAPGPNLRVRAGSRGVSPSAWSATRSLVLEVSEPVHDHLGVSAAAEVDAVLVGVAVLGVGDRAGRDERQVRDRLPGRVVEVRGRG